jgi:hypothetical protein
MMPIAAYSAIVAKRNQYPIQARDMPICSAMASRMTKAMKPPV